VAEPEPTYGELYSSAWSFTLKKENNRDPSDHKKELFPRQWGRKRQLKEPTVFLGSENP